MNAEVQTKEQKYHLLYKQLSSLAEGEGDLISLMSNFAAMLHESFHFWWTGFYMVKPVAMREAEAGDAAHGHQDSKSGIGDSQSLELALGPFQGPVACMHIGYGRGVCGTAWRDRRTIVVPDVEQFPGHIACSSESRSEIVVPIFVGDEVVAELDIDSRELGTFDDVDAQWLRRIVELLPYEREIHLAAGCFWGAEKYLQLIHGVVFTEVGFANGNTADPTYEEVYTDRTGYAETVRLRYDPTRVSLRFLLEMYFKAIDPTSLNQQGDDCGTRYRTGIYYSRVSDREVIDQVVADEAKKYDQPLCVEVEPLRNFHAADEYHQHYLDKNPTGYCHLPLALFELARQARERIG